MVCITQCKDTIWTALGDQVQVRFPSKVLISWLKCVYCDLPKEVVLIQCVWIMYPISMLAVNKLFVVCKDLSTSIIVICVIPFGNQGGT